MYWKHDKEILYSFNFDRIIFIKIHIHEQIVSVWYYFVVLVSSYSYGNAITYIYLQCSCIHLFLQNTHFILSP